MCQIDIRYIICNRIVFVFCFLKKTNRQFRGDRFIFYQEHVLALIYAKMKTGVGKSKLKNFLQRLFLYRKIYLQAVKLVTDIVKMKPCLSFQFPDKLFNFHCFKISGY